MRARVDSKIKCLGQIHQIVSLGCDQSQTALIIVHHDEVHYFSIKVRLHLEAPHRHLVKPEREVYRAGEYVILCLVLGVKCMLSAALIELCEETVRQGPREMLCYHDDFFEG